MEDGQEPLACPEPLRASSAALRQDHARWAASALAASGVPIDQITSLASLVTPLERVRTILRFFYLRAGKTGSAAGMHVGEMLQMIAKYHARLPEADNARIRAWRKLVKIAYRRMTQKNEITVRAAMQPSHEERLYALPGAYIEVARSLLPDSPRQAVSYAMRGTAVKFLHARALRLANVCGLRLDRHLQRDDPKRGRIARVSIPAEETKNDREISMPIPRALADMLEEWIHKFRPLVAAPDCIYLFPGHGTGNRPITPQAMRDAVKSATKHFVGVQLSPHQFRHLTACTFLREHKGQYEPVRHLLNHASAQTAPRHYAGIEQDDTMEHFDETVLNRPRRYRKAKKAGTAFRGIGKAKAENR